MIIGILLLIISIVNKKANRKRDFSQSSCASNCYNSLTKDAS